MRNGDTPGGVATDCLKDELVSDEKRKLFKTRIFLSFDFHLLIVFHMYFWGFAKWITDNRFLNMMCIGTNPYTEWEMLYSLLNSRGPLGIYGDFHLFDKCLILLIMRSTQVLYQRFYGDSDPQANSFRDLLFEELLALVHVSPGSLNTILYQVWGSNSSGNFLTAIINSISNIVMIFIASCHILLKLDGKSFLTCGVADIPIKLVDQFILIFVYGDDLAMSSLSPDINFHTLQAALLEIFDISFTDDVKDNLCTTDFKRHLDGSFLGRKFLPHRWFGSFSVSAPLRLSSIHDSWLFYKGDRSLKILYDKIDNALKEYSLHGVDVFNEHAKVLIEASHAILNYHSPFESWRVAYLSMMESDSPLYCPYASSKVLDEAVVIKLKSSVSSTCSNRG
jgi:hypothetical protein